MLKCIDSALISKQNGHNFNACLLYDPNKNKILLSASDTSKKVNIEHCTMNLMKKLGEFILEE